MSETWQAAPAAGRLGVWTFVDALAVGAAAKTGHSRQRGDAEAPSERIRRLYHCLALRPEAISLEPRTREVLEQLLGERGRLCFVAKSAEDQSRASYVSKLASIKRHASAPTTHGLVFLEVLPDACDVSDAPVARLVLEHDFPVLRVHGKSIPTAMAAVLLRVGADLGVRPEVYLDWSERNPLLCALDFLTTGHGDIAPVLREILRRSQPDAARRPRVRVA